MVFRRDTHLHHGRSLSGSITRSMMFNIMFGRCAFGSIISNGNCSRLNLSRLDSDDSLSIGRYVCGASQFLFLFLDHFCDSRFFYGFDRFSPRKIGIPFDRFLAAFTCVLQYKANAKIAILLSPQMWQRVPVSSAAIPTAPIQSAQDCSAVAQQQRTRRRLHA